MQSHAASSARPVAPRRWCSPHVGIVAQQRAPAPATSSGRRVQSARRSLLQRLAWPRRGSAAAAAAAEAGEAAPAAAEEQALQQLVWWCMSNGAQVWNEMALRSSLPRFFCRPLVALTKPDAPGEVAAEEPVPRTPLHTSWLPQGVGYAESKAAVFQGEHGERGLAAVQVRWWERGFPPSSGGKGECQAAGQGQGREPASFRA